MGSRASDLFAVYGRPQTVFHFAVRVRIQRGTLISSEIDALVSDTEGSVTESLPNTSTVVSSRNYDIAASDYKVNGRVVEPQLGDRILETINGVDSVFQPMRRGKEGAPYEKSKDGLRWILRTKRVANG